MASFWGSFRRVFLFALHVGLTPDFRETSFTSLGFDLMIWRVWVPCIGLGFRV